MSAVPISGLVGGLAAVLSILAASAPGANPPLPTPTTGVRPLQTSVEDSVSFILPDGAAAFQHVRAAGASLVRIGAGWKYIAPQPQAKTKPATFDISNPDDPRGWQSIDIQVRNAVANGLEPILTLYSAPVWATTPVRGAPGFRRADPAAFAQFATAAARRYSGTFDHLPRVRYWEVWNEPNVGSKAIKAGVADWYRALVNRAAPAIHGVHSDNVVIAGSTSPFENTNATAPLQFMRDVLCMRGGEHPRPKCSSKIQFDVWGHHPYTSGGPTHHAARGDDVSLADLPEMKAILDAAVRAHHVISASKVRFWVTEFGWETRPPDPKGVPLALHARWTAEALYRMWAAGVSMVTWFRIRDDPVRSSFYQSGLYFRGEGIRHDRPKPTLRAFRFPFVAFGSGNRVFVWGRTPSGTPGRVNVQQKVAGRWRTLGVLHTDRYGIFSRIYGTKSAGNLRAVLPDSRDMSVPFSLHAPPDHVYPVFGA